MAKRQSTTFGFARTAGVLKESIRRASETRGFAQSRVLTHWAEIAGEDVAAISRPVEVSYGRSGLGATLTLLTTGAQAPMLEMQKEHIRARVNAVYGYNAIARVRITQTASTGFAEGRVDFEHRKPVEPPKPPVVTEHARAVAHGVTDDGLRAALERLAANVISRTERRG